MKRSLTLACLFASSISLLGIEPLIGMLDGEEFPGKLGSINQAGDVQVAGRPAPLKLALMRSVETGHPALRPDGDATIFAEWIDGSRCQVQQLSLTNEKVRLRTSLAPEITLPLDGIRRIRFRPEIDRDIYKQTWNGAPGDFDRLLLEINGEIQVVKGFLVSIDANEVVTSFEGKRASFPRGQVYGIVVAKSDLELPSQNAEARMTNGARIRGKIGAFDGKTLSMNILSDIPLALPWDKVIALSLNADRLVFLSDIDPVEMRSQAIVAPAREWKRDLCITGKRMRLGGKSYRKGIGLTSGMRLIFESASRYDRFSATIGIDDDTGPHGDCEYIIFKDREEVFRKRIRGTDDPEKISIDIKDADAITIEIDYAGNLDLADHANLAEACFIKDEEPATPKP